jgi:replication factor C subunit 1
MPNDIRSFFGGKPAGTPVKLPPKEKPKRGRAKKTVIVEDSDDEEVPYDILA